MNKEQAWQIIAEMVHSHKNLGFQQALLIQEALKIIGKEIFPEPVVKEIPNERTEQ